MTQELIPYLLDISPVKSAIVFGNAFQDYHSQHPNTNIVILIQKENKREISRAFAKEESTCVGEKRLTLLTIPEVIEICKEVGFWCYPRTDREWISFPSTDELEGRDILKFYEAGIPDGCLVSVLSVAACVPNLEIRVVDKRKPEKNTQIIPLSLRIYPYLPMALGIFAAVFLIVRKWGGETVHGKL